MAFNLGLRSLVAVWVGIISLVVNVAWRITNWEDLVSDLSKVAPSVLLEEHLHKHNEHQVVIRSAKKRPSNSVVRIHRCV